jgi:hypothetical protein
MSGATVEMLNEEIASAELGAAAPTLTARIRERPLLSLGLAGLVGFVIGGGASSRTGAAMLMLIARISLKRAATDALADAISSYGTAKRNGSG